MTYNVSNRVYITAEYSEFVVLLQRSQIKTYIRMRKASASLSHAIHFCSTTQTRKHGKECNALAHLKSVLDTHLHSLQSARTRDLFETQNLAKTYDDFVG